MALTTAQLKYYEEACKRFYNGSYKNIGNLLEPQEEEKKTND